MVGCFDNIPHGKLMKAVEPRGADEKGLRWSRACLAAGSMEQGPYHRTYSGTPQGGVLSPLLCNICLHQLDEYRMTALRAKETQPTRVSNARRTPESRKIERKVTRFRRDLKRATGPIREALIKQLPELERRQRATPSYAKEHKHPSNVGYARYADDFVIMVPGQKREAQAIKDDIGKKRQDMGRALREEKTKLPQWRYMVNFLGYQRHGKRTRKGTRIKPILTIPGEKRQKIKEARRVVSGYHQIPAIAAMLQMSARLRGWCTYYRYATVPQATFSELSPYTWWCYAH
jgi:hypothetical protein